MLLLRFVEKYARWVRQGNALVTRKNYLLLKLLIFSQVITTSVYVQIMFQRCEMSIVRNKVHQLQVFNQILIYLALLVSFCRMVSLTVKTIVRHAEDPCLILTWVQGVKSIFGVPRCDVARTGIHLGFLAADAGRKRRRTHQIAAHNIDHQVFRSRID